MPETAPERASSSQVRQPEHQRRSNDASIQLLVYPKVSGKQIDSLGMHSTTGTFRTIIRNRLSRIIAAMRRSPRLQPLHRRYGPLKYKYTLPVYRRIVAMFGRNSEAKSATNISYVDWSARCEALRYDRNRTVERIKQFGYTPTISVIMPVYNTNQEYLRRAIGSVTNQYYPNWELCICDDGSSVTHIRTLLEQYRDSDSRIKVTYLERNTGIAAASNRALSLAAGEFVCLLDHDDVLTPDALYEIASTLQETDADLIYSDEDRLDEGGRRAEPAFKPAWSPDLLLSRMYLGHLCAYRKGILDGIGAFRSNFDGSQDYDLALRFTEATTKIAHIPKILYHWRKVRSSASARSESRDAVTDAGHRAVDDALSRRGVDGAVEEQSVYGLYRVRRTVSPAQSVSIIIPTRDGVKYLSRCIESIEKKTAHQNYEILIVDNGSKSASALAYLNRTPHRVIRLDEPFNFSRLNNVAAREAASEFLLFLNDDAEVISEEWLTAMLEHAQRPEVGAVGAKLLYPDGRIQHAGIIVGAGGVACHAHRGVDGFGMAGYQNTPASICNYNAVTAACMMIRRELFLRLEGFDEAAFAVSFNDVDLCLRLRNLGYLIVYTPYALLYHHESATRGKQRYPKEERALQARWRRQVISDCYYNPNLSRAGDFGIDLSKPESVVYGFAQEVADVALCRLDYLRNVGQSFSVEENNLCAIEVRFEQMGHNAAGIIRLHLRESVQSDSDLSISEFETSRLRSGQWSSFSFERIAHSRGRQFYFFLELLNTTSGLNVLGQGLTDERVGPHFENHVAFNGTLSFRVHTLVQFRYADLSKTPQEAGSI